MSEIILISSDNDDTVSLVEEENGEDGLEFDYHWNLIFDAWLDVRDLGRCAVVCKNWASRCWNSVRQFHAHDHVHAVDGVRELNKLRGLLRVAPCLTSVNVGLWYRPLQELARILRPATSLVSLKLCTAAYKIPDPLAVITAAVPSLQNLALHDCRQLTSTQVAQFLRLFGQNLRSLSLAHCPLVDHRAFAGAGGSQDGAYRLQTLDLTNCRKFASDWSFLASLLRLTSLRLAHVGRLSAPSLAVQLRSLTLLQDLSFGPLTMPMNTSQATSLSAPLSASTSTKDGNDNPFEWSLSGSPSPPSSSSSSSSTAPLTPLSSLVSSQYFALLSSICDCCTLMQNLSIRTGKSVSARPLLQSINRLTSLRRLLHLSLPDCDRNQMTTVLQPLQTNLGSSLHFHFAGEQIP